MNLQISIASPLPAETWIATVDLDGGGRELIRIEDGWFEGEMPAAPRRITGSMEKGEGARASATAAPSGPAGERRPTDVAELFGSGVEVPPSGRLDLQLLWLAPCDGQPQKLPKGKRFGSYEHTLCAKLIGKDAAGKVLRIHAIDAHFSEDTELDVGGKALRFGTIIAMAGDYYAHLDDQAAASFGWAWPAMDGLSGWIAGDYRSTTLAADDVTAVQMLEQHILREAAGGNVGALATALDSARSKYPLRRYLALASQNICHFACQSKGYSERGNPALALYRAYHRRALLEARAAGESGRREGLDAALVVDAFGCHFLTDLFASGHIRVPRGILGERFGIVRGALVLAKLFHDEDNQLGLWVTTLRPSGDRRVVWRAFGDDTLQIEEAKVHLAQIQEAVRRSVADVFVAYCSARKGLASPALPGAEDMIPVPLPPGERPRLGKDVAPSGAMPDFPPNHLPMFDVLGDGRVGLRLQDTYVPLELANVTPAPGIVVP